MRSKLRKWDAETLLERLRDELGRTDLDRLQSLLPLIADDGRIVLGQALEALFPGQPRPGALTAVRQLRKRFRHAAEAAGIDFELRVDSGTRTDPDARFCWFVGPDLAQERAANFSRGESATRGPEPVAQQAVVLAHPDSDERVVKVFVSFASKDAKLKDDLLGRLRDRLANVPKLRVEIWDFPRILPGEGWHREIQQAIATCDLGLLLVSHEFLASDYVRRYELPHFVASDAATSPTKPFQPVALGRFKFAKNVNLRGIEGTQVFLLHGKRSYQELIGRDPKDLFAEELAARLVEFVHKHMPAIPVTRAGPAAPIADAAHERGERGSPGSTTVLALGDACEQDDPALRRLFEAQRRFLNSTGDSEDFVPTRGRATSLEKGIHEDKPARPSDGGEPLDALTFLLRWALEPSEPPFCALLGEYGMGKTTTCQALTRRLLEARAKDPSLPVPVFLDLRRLGDAAKRNPLLAEIIDVVGERSFQGGSLDGGPTPDDVVRLVREGKAIAIFDGLDEVLVHLTPGEGQRFTRELWRVLPPSRLGSRASAGDGPSEPDRQPVVRGKLLISCRTHFFRTLREQQTHFTGEDREGITAADYRALLLLPFSPDQVEEYLAKHLPDANVESLLALIRSVHNLQELAERPYTLSLIARHIPRLEEWKLAGRAVSGVTLYEEMVRSWLERDTGKHQLTPDHKRRLMEHFAAALWRSGKRSWSIGDLEQWLIDFLEENPRIKAHYEARDRELLKEDLRTATFLVREGEDDFRFAHASLQEFFLASYLAHALIERRFDAWELERPSDETLDFLGQLLGGGDEAAALAALREIRGAYRPRVSELALAYGLSAGRKGYPAHSLAGSRLDAADLRGWSFSGAVGELLDLRGVSFCGARLADARFRSVDVSEADLSSADLAEAEFLGSRARKTQFTDADLTGTIFRDLDLAESDFVNARLYRTQYLRCRLEEVEGLESHPGGLFANCSQASRTDATTPHEEARLAALTGHAGFVLACAFSPDGSTVASAGNDGSMRLWDARTGEPLRTLTGHQGAVWACAFSPDGSTLSSAGGDGTVRLWNARTGEPLRTLTGHQGTVWACAFSPDGSTLASVGNDRSVRLWDARTGEPLRTLTGHQGEIKDCAFSSDSCSLVSAGYDGSLRLWNARTGESLRTLTEHQGAVLACAFSPDDSTLASAGIDGSVRLWEARTGEPLRTVAGHEGPVWACAFSPDGSTLASAGFDGSVRLWDARTGEPLRTLTGHHGAAWACAFSSDGSTLASAGNDSSVRLWHARTGEPLRTLTGDQDRIRACGFSPDGFTLASAGDDGSVRLWQARTGEPQRTLTRQQCPVWAVAFSPSGSTVASAGDDSRVHLWDTCTGEPLRTLTGHQDNVRALAFSPDGITLASAGDDGSVRLWDARTGEPLRTLTGHEGPVWACAYSPDGSTLASVGNDPSVRLWYARTGKPLRTLTGHQDWIRACAFSPDGSTLVSAGDDSSVRLWDARTGEPLRTLTGHQGWIRACAFSPDGSTLGSAGSDGSVRLWDARTGEPLRTLIAHQGSVWACAFSPDGSTLASAGSDGSVRVWDLPAGKERFCVALLPDGEYAVLRSDGSGAIAVSPGAWRWLGWLTPGNETEMPTRYPAEIFGPLPESPVL